MKTLFKILISILILGYLVSRLDFTAFINAISQAQWVYFMLACFSQYFILLIPPCSLKILSSAMGLDISILRIYLINIQSMFYSLIVPGDLAAGVARFVKFSKAHRGPALTAEKTRSAILAMMTTDRLLTMGALILPLTPLLFIAPLPEKTVWFRKASIIISILFITALVVIYRVPWRKLLHLIPKGWARLSDYGKALAQALHSFSISKLLFSFGLALLFHALTILFVDLPLLKSVGIHVPFLELASMVIAVRFLRYIPATYAGIGLREGLYPLFLQHYGVSFEMAFTLGLLTSSTVIICGFVGGIAEAFSFFKK